MPRVLSQAQESRSQWLLLKQFPQLLGVAQSEDLTVEQEAWLLAQVLLDQGMAVCPRCETLGAGHYCEACGTRLGEERQTRRCPTCATEGSGQFCAGCGQALLTSVVADLEAATFDWDNLEDQLTPFLGGFTTQDRDVFEGRHANGTFLHDL